MYTKGEYDSNLRRIMGKDIPEIERDLEIVAEYLELQVQLNLVEKLREYPDIYPEEEYKNDLVILAKRARITFNTKKDSE